MKKSPPKHKKVWCLLVFVTNNYINFKIEKGTYLGKLKKTLKVNDTLCHTVEWANQSIDYLSVDDIFNTQEDAEKHLLKILQSKYEYDCYQDESYLKKAEK